LRLPVEVISRAPARPHTSNASSALIGEERIRSRLDGRQRRKVSGSRDAKGDGHATTLPAGRASTLGDTAYGVGVL